MTTIRDKFINQQIKNNGGFKNTGIGANSARQNQKYENKINEWFNTSTEASKSTNQVNTTNTNHSVDANYERLIIDFRNAVKDISEPQSKAIKISILTKQISNLEPRQCTELINKLYAKGHGERLKAMGIKDHNSFSLQFSNANNNKAIDKVRVLANLLSQIQNIQDTQVKQTNLADWPDTQREVEKLCENSRFSIDADNSTINTQLIKTNKPNGSQPITEPAKHNVSHADIMELQSKAAEMSEARRGHLFPSASKVTYAKLNGISEVYFITYKHDNEEKNGYVVCPTESYVKQKTFPTTLRNKYNHVSEMGIEGIKKELAINITQDEANISNIAVARNASAKNVVVYNMFDINSGSVIKNPPFNYCHFIAHSDKEYGKNKYHFNIKWKVLDKSQTNKLGELGITKETPLATLCTQSDSPIVDSPYHAHVAFNNSMNKVNNGNETRPVWGGTMKMLNQEENYYRAYDDADTQFVLVHDSKGAIKIVIPTQDYEQLTTDQQVQLINGQSIQGNQLFELEKDGDKTKQFSTQRIGGAFSQLSHTKQVEFFTDVLLGQLYTLSQDKPALHFDVDYKNVFFKKTEESKNKAMIYEDEEESSKDTKSTALMIDNESIAYLAHYQVLTNNKIPFIGNKKSFFPLEETFKYMLNESEKKIVKGAPFDIESFKDQCPALYANHLCQKIINKLIALPIENLPKVVKYLQENLIDSKGIDALEKLADSDFSQISN